MNRNTGDVERIRVAVDRLTKPVDLPITLDDGTLTYGRVPSLWDLATEALATGDEAQEGSSGRRHERSPVDLDLMEMRSIVVEFTCRELRRFRASTDGTIPKLIRRLATEAVTREPDDLDFWAYRFEQWARLIANYLTPVNRGRRLRASCPRCGTQRVEIETSTGPVLAHPIFVQFGSDGLIRAAQCQACSVAWFRGDGLLELAAEVGATPLPVPMVANSA